MFYTVNEMPSLKCEFRILLLHRVTTLHANCTTQTRKKTNNNACTFFQTHNSFPTESLKGSVGKKYIKRSVWEGMNTSIYQTAVKIHLAQYKGLSKYNAGKHSKGR